jgi:hypothetical protein
MQNRMNPEENERLNKRYVNQQIMLLFHLVRKNTRRVLFSSLIASGCFFMQPAYAQLSSNAQEVWPSIDAYLRLNQKWRLYSTVAGTRMEESSYADGAIGIFADYFIFPPALAQKWVPQRKDSLPGKFFLASVWIPVQCHPTECRRPF